ncbi:MAG: hypothetical protein F6K40_10480 [Okeania sp. SIO3I5]|uniref:hypothetical protein n=1 Tax=Okeania sp. SIO3I5 TaxID=2607805 RepID=UPI0013BC29D7|nr:hypothetical protein [Okeania sp. SIO3I5]NEQ36678.1 hypothetical protein [Okeania sp. SIO3I5]
MTAHTDYGTDARIKSPVEYLSINNKQDEKKWEENFANSQDQLAQLAEEAKSAVANAEFKQAHFSYQHLSLFAPHDLGNPEA